MNSVNIVGESLPHKTIFMLIIVCRPIVSILLDFPYENKILIGFSKRIKTERLKQGLSQEELAEKLASIELTLE